MTRAAVTIATDTPPTFAELARPLASVPRESYRDAFLIADLLTTRITFLAGEPKAGKSLLAAGMIRALVDGHDQFLGQEVYRRIDHVIYGWTDDGAEAEMRERLIGTEAEHAVTMVPMHLVGDRRSGFTWDHVIAGITAQRPGLFVLDNVLGALEEGEDIASSVTASNVIRRLRPIVEAGIPVLAITHTPKGASEGLTTASSVIGGRAMAGGARGIIVLRNPQKGRRLETGINRARRDLHLQVDVQRETPGSEVPVWSVQHELSEAEARAERADAWAERVEYYERECEGLGVRAAAAKLAEQFDVPPETARGWLRPGRRLRPA